MKYNKNVRTSIKLWLTIVITVLLDQITKFNIFDKYDINSSNPLIDNLLWLTPRINKGAAFSFLANIDNSNALFIIISIAFIPMLLWVFYANYRNSPAWAFGFLIGGAIGNTIDRLLPDKGVRDFIDLRWWPVFNIADAAIAIGCFALIVWSIFFTKKKTYRIPLSKL